MDLKRFDFKEITVGKQMDAVSDKIFIPSLLRKQEPPPPPPTFNEAQMQASEREGFKKGFAAGEKEGRAKTENEQAEVNRKLLAMQQQFAAALGPLFDNYKKMVLQVRKDVPALALAVAKKIAADALQENAEKVITEVALRTCEAMISEPELTITLHESLADTMEKAMHELAARMPAASNIVIVRDPDMPLSDCRIEWQNGSLERITAQMWQQVEKALSNIGIVAERDANTDMQQVQQEIDVLNQTPDAEKKE